MEFVEQWMPMLKLGGYGVVGLGVLTALAIVIYIVRSTTEPLLRVVQWLLWHTPGAAPSPIVGGLVHGLRLVAWSSLIALIGWFLLSLRS